MILLSFILFAIGIYGVLAKRDLLRLLISVSIILGSITLLLATQGTAGSYSFALFIWVVEVVEIVIALAVFLYLARNDKQDIAKLQQLKW